MPISATFKDDDGAPVKIVVAELKQILCVKG
jgi:hypothetical protein